LCTLAAVVIPKLPPGIHERRFEPLDLVIFLLMAAGQGTCWRNDWARRLRAICIGDPLKAVTDMLPDRRWSWIYLDAFLRVMLKNAGKVILRP